MSGDKFNREEEMSLIEFVSSYKCLYDASHKDYKDVIVKDNIWTEISSHFAGKNGDDCKKRWRSIRDTYKRMKREGKLGTGSAATKRNKWPLANYLSFLQNVPEERRTTSNIHEDSQDSIDDSLVDTDNVRESHNVQDLDDYDAITSPLSVASTSATSSVSKRLKKKKNMDDNIADILHDNKRAREKIIEAFTERNAQVTKDDDVDLFYKSIALSVKRLPPHLISQAKLQHLQIINNLELQANHLKSASTVRSSSGLQFDSSHEQYQLPGTELVNDAQTQYPLMFPL